MNYINDHIVKSVAVHEHLMAALAALEKLTTACTTNAGVMEHISLSVLDAAIEAEGAARAELDALAGGSQETAA